jgi:hypothetical protein
MDREDKMRAIFDEVVDKTQYYHSLRKVRAPKVLEDGLKAASAWLEHRSHNTPAMSPTVQTALKQEPRGSHERDIGINQMSTENTGNQRNLQGAVAYMPETQYYGGQGSKYMSQSPEGGLSDSSTLAASTIPSIPGTGPFGGRLEIDWVSCVTLPRNYTW